ncbi:flavodoxin domain-containing protein [Phytomonospora sp. NPDC050363]|uniref:flavodoxin domain-containing protein n=1 Tax=Phytomonospora sp. NPDC050363 TaxID=3155642 RepID=UPI0033DD585D
MKVLVAAASRHGSTEEISAVLAQVLRAAGFDVDRRRPEEVRDLADADAVVLGSAVYLGHWLRPALRFADRHHAALSTLPVWLFSTGPVGDPPRPAEDPADIGELMRTTGAREHRLFAGRLDRARLGLAERVVTGMLRVPEGDYRDLDDVRTWAASIASSIRAGSRQGL